MEKATASAADIVLIDLEDAVAEVMKPEARDTVAAFIAANAGQRDRLWVRKAAEIALARGLAELTAGSGVTRKLNSVLPGPTASSSADGFLDEYAAKNGIPRSDAESHLVAQIRPSSLLKICLAHSSFS
jgi:hypothetical protein